MNSQASGLNELVETLHDAVERKDPPEVLSVLARHLVVRSSGYIEQSVKELARGFVAGKSGGMVRTFAHSWLERSRNPSPEALLALLGRFDAGLEAQFEAFLEADDQLYLRELQFLVDRRNRIAHGLNQGVGHQRAIELSVVASDVVDWFVLRLNPS